MSIVIDLTNDVTKYRFHNPASAEDHQWLIELHNDPEVLRNLTDSRTITFNGHMKWFTSLSMNQMRSIFLVDGIRVGFCKMDVDRSNNSCVMGADIHKDHRGRGYAKPMWRKMLKYAFRSWGLYRCSLTTAAFNDIGYKIYTDLGFKEEGKFVKSLLRDGEYHDQICMYLLKENWDAKQV